jgi:hypothetical protein
MVYAWAVEGDADSENIISNTFQTRMALQIWKVDYHT